MRPGCRFGLFALYDFELHGLIRALLCDAFWIVFRSLFGVIGRREKLYGLHVRRLPRNLVLLLSFECRAVSSCMAVCFLCGSQLFFFAGALAFSRISLATVRLETQSSAPTNTHLHMPLLSLLWWTSCATSPDLHFVNTRAPVPCLLCLGPPSSPFTLACGFPLALPLLLCS
eukprot:RCo031162